MHLASQVCSRELSKRLNELGIKQESLFYWKRWIPPKRSTYIEPEWRLSLGNSFLVEYEVISAFTVAELGEMLPDYIELSRIGNIQLCTLYSEDSCNENNISTMDDTEANARAKMLIYLIENGFVKPQGESHAISERKESE